MSLGEDLARLFGREFDRLAEQVAAYENESDLWKTTGAQKNPPGALAVHLVGALSNYIGAALGGTGYVRDRPAEFAARDVPRDEILRSIRECRDTVVPILDGLSDETLAGTHPGKVPSHYEGITARGFLLQLLWHFGWHNGQIYYHRLALAGSDPA